jgi:hypothetical protein
VFVDPHVTPSSRNLHSVTNNVRPRPLAKIKIRNAGKSERELAGLDSIRVYNKVLVNRGLLHEEEWPAGEIGKSMYPVLGEEGAPPDVC